MDSISLFPVALEHQCPCDDLWTPTRRYWHQSTNNISRTWGDGTFHESLVTVPPSHDLEPPPLPDCSDPSCSSAPEARSHWSSPNKHRALTDIHQREVNIPTGPGSCWSEGWPLLGYLGIIWVRHPVTCWGLTCFLGLFCIKQIWTEVNLHLTDKRTLRGGHFSSRLLLFFWHF